MWFGIAYLAALSLLLLGVYEGSHGGCVTTDRQTAARRARALMIAADQSPSLGRAATTSS